MNSHKDGQTYQETTYFLYSILIICLAYAIYEFFYIPYWALSADEFVFARHIYEYTYNIPYRDFPPYKAVLGYYLLSIPFYFSHALLDPLFYIKEEIALINTLFIALTCYSAARFFNKNAIILTLLAIIANQSFLIYSADLRVDMLTSWVCLFAALSVLQQRLHIAGALMGIAFLISQKALWTLCAIDGAMIICWLAFASPLYSLRSLFTFNISAALPIVVYLVIWSCIADSTSVLHNFFYEAYIQAGIDWYTPIYFKCWTVVLQHGPLLFLLWPLTLISLIGKHLNDTALQRRLFILCFASLSLFFIINYKQAFPYNFVFTIPAFFLLYSDFISWLLDETPTLSPGLSTTTKVKVSIISYSLLIFLIINLASLPFIYNVLVFIPFLLSNYINCNVISANHGAPSARVKIYLVVFIAAGILLPLSNALEFNNFVDGGYQQSMIKLGDSLIRDEGDYLGGIPYLYRKDQSIDGMKNLIGPAMDYIQKPTDKLETLLLPSLYLAPTSIDKVLDDFERKPVKVIFDSYRIHYLPPKILDYINTHYLQYSGSVYLYSPEISSKQLTFTLKFSGEYEINTTSRATITIDNHHLRAGNRVNLQQGDHLTSAGANYRLILIPIDPSQPRAPENPSIDAWFKMIRAIMS